MGNGVDELVAPLILSLYLRCSFLVADCVTFFLRIESKQAGLHRMLTFHVNAGNGRGNITIVSGSLLIKKVSKRSVSQRNLKH